MASVRSLDNAYGYTGFGTLADQIPQQGRIMRNLIEGGDLVMSHILHFYHLAALDYISTEYAGCPLNPAGTAGTGVAPWAPKDNISDMVGALPGTTGIATELILHYVQALNIRRQAHQMIALASGKQPCQPSFTPGGVTNVVTDAMITDFTALLSVINNFIDNTYIGDIVTVAKTFSGTLMFGSAADGVGAGCKKYLSYGTFPTSSGGMIISGGFLNATADYPGWSLSTFDVNNIQEHISYSFYDSGGGAYDKLHPSKGVTSPAIGKTGAYSWLKAPRYCTTPTAPTSGTTNVCEVGPLARVLVNFAAGNPVFTTPVTNLATALGLPAPSALNGLRSVLGRHAARAVECQVIAHAMTGWLTELNGATTMTGQTYRHRATPKQSTGYGLTEAPRGALGHWVGIKGKKISHYQCVVPTTWNASPMDDYGQQGPMEQALMGVDMNSASTSGDATGRTKVGRIVRSFDPCIACAVHIVSPDKKTVKKFELKTQ